MGFLRLYDALLEMQMDVYGRALRAAVRLSGVRQWH